MSHWNFLAVMLGLGWLTTFGAAYGQYTLDRHTIDGGGAISSGGGWSVRSVIGQPEASPTLAGGNWEVSSGFLRGVAGVPAATLIAAVSRKDNPADPDLPCDVPLIPGIRSEPHQGGISEVRLTFDVVPGAPGSDAVTLEQADCGAPAYAVYAGTSTISAHLEGNELVLAFTPGLENGRTYRITVNPSVTSHPNRQFVEVRGLAGDVNGDGFVNATDRSAVVGAWTGGGFTCPTDVTNDGLTNATDRSAVVGAWTGTQNCAP